MASTQVNSGRLCAAGLHPMDPNWDSCPYCENARRTKARTEAHAGASASSEDRGTRTGGGSAGGRRETKAVPSGLSSDTGGQAGVEDTRRILGILVTYTWRPEGQLFTVREGKNFIGAGDISSETSHRRCEILIETDPMLSSEHALILCRHGRYDLIDQKSSNGTFLDGDLVPIAGTTLQNYAEIRTGSTVWTFVMIAPPETSGSVATSS
ncbi:MAG: FHA domain-containing protein [Pyrinomonadaceae bacterium]